MIMDAQNRPSFNQTLAVAAGTLVSTDSIDLLTNIDQPGRNGPVRMVSVLTETMTGGTSVQAQLISSAAGNLATPTVLVSGPVVPIAEAVAGKRLLDVPIPDTNGRYLGLQYVLVGAHTAGKVTSGIVAGTDRPSTEIPMVTGL